jgi:hypothetical protein
MWRRVNICLADINGLLQSFEPQKLYEYFLGLSRDELIELKRRHLQLLRFAYIMDNEQTTNIAAKIKKTIDLIDLALVNIPDFPRERNSKLQFRVADNAKY